MASPTSSSSSPRPFLPAPSLRIGLLLIAALHPSPLCRASPLPQTSSANVADLTSTTPRTWALDAAANQIRNVQHPGSFVRYRMHTRDAKGDRVRDIIESRQGTVGRLLFKDGHPLTAQEDQAERQRLTDILTDPSEFNKHSRGDASSKKLATDLIQLMPDAMIYTYTPGQPQLPGSPSPRQVVLDFHPNPHWSPPSTTSQGLTGLRGRMWIDPESRQILRMDGEIFQGVNFGWGMLARVYPGGSLTLTQVPVSPSRWIFSAFSEHIRARALLVKSVDINTTIEGSNFQVLPSPVDFKQAIQMLLDTPLPTS